MEEVKRRDQQKNEEPPPLDLNWSTLLPDSDDPPPELVVRGRGDLPARCLASMGSDENSYADYQGMTDLMLEESIARYSKNLQDLGHKLPDGGAKLRAMLNRLREEKDRRKLRWHGRRNHQAADGYQRIMSVTIPASTNEGPSDAFSEETTSSSEKQSSRFSQFSKSMDENNVCRIGGVDKEPLNFNHGKKRRKKSKRKLSPEDWNKSSPSSRNWPFQSPSQISLDRKQRVSDSNQRGKSSLSSHSFCSELFPHHRRNNDLHVRPCRNSKPTKEVTVVLDDEEECHLKETSYRAGKSAERDESKIYYPSRDDPGCVEIHYADLDCLKPEMYLTSPIMNFYILYLQLQASLLDRGINDYLFFNTYFYNKLQEAVSCKRDVRGASFARLRRWWKGVNIFQKAYVLIPIHEELHWSLAIICIPDKVDKSGPIILHLDSLHFHRSKSIFDNIRRFLMEEWNHMKRDGTPLDLLMADEVWERLPRQISERKIMVPQQKNDYDCGLFVLYFMERFIEEAPERLKKKDLAMFGKQWFKAEEASNLRVKIHKLLLAELEKAKEVRNTPDGSPHLEHILPSPDSENNVSPSNSGSNPFC